MKRMPKITALRRPTGKTKSLVESPANETVDLSLRLLERLATLRGPIGVSEPAREFASSKATVYRHLQTLMLHGFVRREATTMRYAAGIKLFILGERLRERFDVLAMARDDLARLRDETGEPATLSALVDIRLRSWRSCKVTRSSISERNPAPCLICMRALTETLRWRSVPKGSWSIALRNRSKPGRRIPSARPSALARAVVQVRSRGWATAPNRVLQGVNGLAAPLFNHGGDYDVAALRVTHYRSPSGSTATLTSGVWVCLANAGRGGPIAR